MRVLVFHGYLLRGTGSNVYNASLARALARMGHEVHLLCQDRDAASLPWVDAVGDWQGGRLRVRAVRDGDAPGAVTAYLPDTGGLLPVYVADDYEGFSVKTFGELSGPELDDYLDANVAAVGDVVAAAGQPDAALANHLVMGPAILARCGLAFAAKIHGSALEYTVRPNPRFLPHAREGMAAVGGVLVASRHTAESLWTTVADPSLPGRTRLGPPGVDAERFAVANRADAVPRLRALAEAVGRSKRAGLGRDPAAAAAALTAFADCDGPRIVFVGKLIVSKGIDLLLAAWPLVVAANPGARLCVVAFGAYADGVRRLLAALDAGELEAARTVAAAGRALEGGEEGALPILGAFLDAPPPGYAEAARAAAGSVALAGRLEHEEVAELLPAAEAMVVPSTFPESFGMVAAEAAAAGALPVCADHSGLGEVAARLSAALPAEVAELVSFPVGAGAVEAIADRVNRWLALDARAREQARAALAETATRLWSWEGVARGVIAASQGRLDELPNVPA